MGRELTHCDGSQDALSLELLPGERGVLLLLADPAVEWKERSSDGVTNLNRKCRQQLPRSKGAKKQVPGVAFAENKFRRLVLARLGLVSSVLLGLLVEILSELDAERLDDLLILMVPESKMRIINLLSSKP